MSTSKKSIAAAAHDLHVTYNGNAALDGLTANFPEGKISVIIGPNGSGKTTLLRALAGFVMPTAGTVTVLGKQPQDIRNGIGYVPQRFTIDSHIPLTVEEFLRLSYPACTKEKFHNHLKSFGLEGKAQDMVGNLSGGQLQRLLIIRALLHTPEILLLDEPVSGIDVTGEETFFDLIDTVHKKYGMTIIMVLHEVEVVYGFADHVVCLNKKHVCEGDPKNVLTQEVLEKLYGKNVNIYSHTNPQ